VVLNEQGTFRDKPLYFFLERYKAAFINEVQVFVENIQNNTLPPVSGKDGLAPVLIALACQESLRTGKAIKVQYT